MNFDFDTVHKRIGSDSIKWDYAYQDGELKPRDACDGALALSTTLPMWLSDMDFATAPVIVEALEQRARHGIFGYTRPGDGYYQAIIKWTAERYGWAIEKDWILISAGVVPAISMAIQAFTEPGDKVIIQPPVFGPFTTSPQFNGREVVRNSLILEDQRYLMDFVDLEAKAADPKAKMLILCSPHNPVGRVWSCDELTRVGEICQQHDVLILSDEIHCDLIYSWSQFTSFGTIDSAFNDRLILCNGPSKSFNLPGVTTSNTIIPNPRLREQFQMVQRNLNDDFGVNVFAALALQTAYEQGLPWLRELLIYLEANYCYLRDTLSRTIPGLRIHRAEAMYLIWIDCRALGLDEPQLLNALLEAGVYLESGSEFGSTGQGFVRINIACPRTTLEQALERMRGALAHL